MHRTHAGHKSRPFPGAVLQHIERVLPLSNRGLTGLLIEYEILIGIKELDFFKGNAHGPGSHHAEILPGESLPLGASRQVQLHDVHQPVGFQAHPLSPVQIEPGRHQMHRTIGAFLPLTFVQRMTVGIGHQDSPPQRAIQHHVAGSELVARQTTQRHVRKKRLVAFERQARRILKNGGKNRGRVFQTFTRAKILRG